MTRAVVQSGWGAAAAHIPTLDLPIDAYPGTLNVTLLEDAYPSTPAGDLPWFNGRTVPWRHCTVNGVQAVAIGGTVDMAAGTGVEIAARIHIRTAFRLGDGDEVEVVFL